MPLNMKDGRIYQEGSDDQAVSSESHMTIRLDKMGAIELVDSIIQAP